MARNARKTGAALSLRVITLRVRRRGSGWRLAQSGGTRNSGLLTVARQDEGDLVGPGIYNASHPALADVVEERRQHGRDSSAHDNDVWFQQVEDVSQPISEDVEGFVDYFAGHGVAGLPSLVDHFAGHGLNVAARHFQEHGFRV